MSYLRTALIWFGSRPSEQQHIFVLGAPRSGTSLLKNILIANSSLIGTDRESTGLFRLRDFSHFQIGELNESDWDRVLEKSRGLPHLFDNLASEYLERANGSQFVDKVNVKAWRLRYLNKYFPNSRFVNIVRDGRDSLCSARRHPNVKQSETVAAYAAYWAKCVTLPGEVLPSSSVHHLRYEDLVTNPSSRLHEVMDFLGVPFEDQQISVDIYSSVSSLKKREVHKNLAKPINTSSVGRWQEQLTESETGIFTRYAGKELAKWGFQA